MKQGNNNNKLDVFNPFWGLQPMLSPRSRTLPPIKTGRSSRDFRTSRIPVRIPIPREKQQRRMTFLDGKVNPGIDGPFPKFSSNLQQRNQFCARTRQHEEKGKKPEKARKKKHLLDENSERIRVETSSLPSYGGTHNRFEKDENKLTQEKAAGESEMKLIKSSSWANSFDHGGTAMHKIQREENFPQKQSSIKNELGEKRMRERGLGRHVKPLQDKLTVCREVTARDTSLSGQIPPAVVTDSYEGDGDLEEENKNLLEYEKRGANEKVNCRRQRSLAKLEDKRLAAPVKRLTSPFGGQYHGILCKPKLHKIHSIPLTPHKMNETYH